MKILILLIGILLSGCMIPLEGEIYYGNNSDLWCHGTNCANSQTCRKSYQVQVAIRQASLRYRCNSVYLIQALCIGNPYNRVSVELDVCGTIRHYTWRYINSRRGYYFNPGRYYPRPHYYKRYYRDRYYKRYRAPKYRKYRKYKRHRRHRRR